MPLIGAVYSLAQARVRRIIVPDNDKQLPDPAWVLPGEAMLTYDAKLGSALTTAQDQVTQFTGRKPDSDDCAVIDKTGAVVHVIKADSAIDTHSDGVLVEAFPGVGLGCTYDAIQKTFTRPAYVLQASVDEITGAITPQKNIPAEIISKPVESKQ